MREISAAVVNVSGRQRMLSQRTALFSLRLVCSRNETERQQWRDCLLETIQLMEKSHNALIEGDANMKLPGHPSPAIRAMYFEAPLHLDKKIQEYIAASIALANAKDSELTADNPYLCYILDAATMDLLAALDAVVTQYESESEAQHQAIALHQAELYQQSCTATAVAQAQAKELEKALCELKQAQDQLIHSEKMSSLGQLVAGVAHEINNPVSFIYGNVNHAIKYVQDLLYLLHLYQKQYTNPTAQIQDAIAGMDLSFLIEDLPKVVSSIKIGAERMHQIVLSLRNFSRKNEAQMTHADLHEGIESTLLILQNRLKHGNHSPIQVIKEYDNLPTVQCYSGEINQVFMNLLGNAIDALEEGIGNRSQSFLSANNHCKLGINHCVLPTIWIRTTLKENQVVVIQIADNGKGMTEEVRQRLFDPFFTTKPIGKGTGLGLSISYHIVVEKHGGQLKCVSAPDSGTEFSIEIPLHPQKAQKTEENPLCERSPLEEH